MWANMWSRVDEWFNEFTMGLKEFFINNSRNPLLWIAIIIIALLIFESVYRSLHRD